MSYSQQIALQSAPDFADELVFHGSPAVTLGVELEIQILDKQDGQLVPGALRVLDACKEEDLLEVDGEFLLSMVEAKTGICRNVTAVKESLFQVLRKLRNIASAVGYDLALGGTHPFSSACKNAISQGERYDRMRKRQGWMAYDEALFGLHVHVGVPDAESALRLVNLLVPYLPHLLALSANSPFWQGVDTQFSSARAVLFHPSPQAGMPLYFSSWGEFCHHYQIMKDNGIYQSTKDLYWDLRPRPDFGTLEFRICDAPASLDVILALTSLIRCLVIDGLKRLNDDPDLGRQGLETSWLASENKFLAARYGLAAECALEPGGPRQTMKQHTEELARRLLRTAVGADQDYLQTFAALEGYESGSDRLRRLYRATGNWVTVLREMKTHWRHQLDKCQ